jgi:hypothetical protein
MGAIQGVSDAALDEGNADSAGLLNKRNARRVWDGVCGRLLLETGANLRRRRPLEGKIFFEKILSKT